MNLYLTGLKYLHCCSFIDQVYPNYCIFNENTTMLTSYLKIRFLCHHNMAKNPKYSQCNFSFSGKMASKFKLKIAYSQNALV